MEMKKIGLTETNLFHFHRIFKNGGQGVGSSEPPESPLDLTLLVLSIFPLGVKRGCSHRISAMSCLASVNTQRECAFLTDSFENTYFPGQ